MAAYPNPNGWQGQAWGEIVDPAPHTTTSGWNAASALFYAGDGAADALFPYNGSTRTAILWEQGRRAPLYGKSAPLRIGPAPAWMIL